MSPIAFEPKYHWQYIDIILLKYWFYLYIDVLLSYLDVITIIKLVCRPTNYQCFSAGLIYIFSDASQKTPKHVISLHRGYFGGCRRVFNSNRPHTFEVLPFGQRGFTGTFQFAAADDYECSEWLQTFIEISSTVSWSKLFNDSLVSHIYKQENILL